MLYFYTVTTPEQSHLCDTLKKSLARFGYDLTILPLYENNNFSKLKISSFLESTLYNNNDFIVICDGFDVVCASNPEKIIDFFTEHNDTDILISSENMFGNNMVCIKDYYDRYNEKNGTTGKYLNSGVVMGRANKIKQFYKQLVSCTSTLRDYYIPPDRRDTTGDQTYIINYLYHIDFVNYKDIKIQIDIHDKLTFTNTIINRPFNARDYIFIHTWGIYIKDPNYKYIRDQQYKKWSDINSELEL